MLVSIVYVSMRIICFIILKLFNSYNFMERLNYYKKYKWEQHYIEEEKEII
jgi:hypothetical protein